MGYYINPQGESKESFLMREGTPLMCASFPEDDDLALVCLVDNGAFTAAGVCYDEDEMRAFDGARDMRPKRWFTVPKHLLYDVVGENLERVMPR